MILRDVPPPLERAIRERAKRARTSVGRVIIQLLEARLRGPRHERIYHDLDDLAGTWSADDAADFDRALAAQRSMAPEPWP